MEDRISSLPDPLLHNILSYVPLKYAIRTSCLSKRWTPLWRSLPDLVFRDTQDFRCLVEARLGFESYDYGSWMNGVKELLRSVIHVEKLCLGSWFLQVLSLHAGKVLLSSLSNCQSLILDATLDKWDLPGIATMLKSCPLLEVLTIDMTKRSDFAPSTILQSGFPSDCDEKSFWSSQMKRGCSEFQVQHLKFVSIIGLVPHRNEPKIVNFLQFLLKQGELLEKVSITTKFDRKSTQDVLAKFKLSQLLLNLSRSSSVAIQLT